MFRSNNKDSRFDLNSYRSKRKSFITFIGWGTSSWIKRKLRQRCIVLVCLLHKGEEERNHSNIGKQCLIKFFSLLVNQLITVIAVFQLVEQGKLNLHSPVHDILPEIKELEKGYKNPITLHHLITHTAGMSYPFFNQDTKNWVSILLLCSMLIR